MTAERSGAEVQDSSKGLRRKHSMQFKLQVVRELLKPGASAREIAQRHGLHESLIGAWRRQHARGRLADRSGVASQGGLMPVQVAPQTGSLISAVEAPLVSRTSIPGSLHIEFSHGHRLSVRGEVDASALSAVIRELSRT